METSKETPPLPQENVQANVPGRFQNGGPPGPGRKKNELLPPDATFLDAAVGTLTVAEFAKVVRKTVAAAKAGDPAARQWLSDDLLPTASELEKRRKEAEEEAKRQRRRLARAARRLNGEANYLDGSPDTRR